ncbi:hypothetical protein EJB05_22990, partial [Eragrostis curvula]
FPFLGLNYTESVIIATMDDGLDLYETAELYAARVQAEIVNLDVENIERLKTAILSQLRNGERAVRHQDLRTAGLEELKPR